MWRLVPLWQSGVCRSDDQGVMSSSAVSVRACEPAFNRGMHCSPTVCKFFKRAVSVREEDSCPHSCSVQLCLMALPLAIIFSVLLVSIAVQDFSMIDTSSTVAQIQLNPVDPRVLHIDLPFKSVSVWDMITGKLGHFFSIRKFDLDSFRSNQTKPLRSIPSHEYPDPSSDTRSEADGDELQELLQPSEQQSFSRSNAGLLSDLIAQANQRVRKLKNQEDLNRRKTATGQDRVLPKFRKLTSLPNETCSNASEESLDGNQYCSDRFVHIAMTLDVNYLRGSMAAIYSILLHADCSSYIRFHFVAIKGKEELEKILAETLPFLQFQTYTFDESTVKSLISHTVRHALEEPLNYARFYLAQMIDPCVKRIIYLDSDVLVLDRIEELWMTNMGNSTVGTPEYCHANFPSYFTEKFWTNSSLASTFANKHPCYFNSGMMLINLDRWRRTECTAVLEYWMKVQKEQHIYELGSLPPLLLAFAGNIQAIDHRWNQHGLGGDIHKGDCRPTRNEPASLLHWSGGGKPWQRLDVNQPCPIDNIWAQYDLLELKSLF